MTRATAVRKARGKRVAPRPDPKQGASGGEAGKITLTASAMMSGQDPLALFFT